MSTGGWVGTSEVGFSDRRRRKEKEDASWMNFPSLYPGMANYPLLLDFWNSKHCWCGIQYIQIVSMHSCFTVYHFTGKLQVLEILSYQLKMHWDWNWELIWKSMSCINVGSMSELCFLGLHMIWVGYCKSPQVITVCNLWWTTTVKNQI